MASTPTLWRKLRLRHWLLVIILATFSYGWWKGYNIRTTIVEAQAFWSKWEKQWPVHD